MKFLRKCAWAIIQGFVLAYLTVIVLYFVGGAIMEYKFTYLLAWLTIIWTIICGGIMYFKWLFRKRRFKKIYSKMCVEGYTEKFFDDYKKYLLKDSKTLDRAVFNNILLAREYLNAGEYDKCASIMNGLNVKSVSPATMLLYALVMADFSVQNDDISNSREILSTLDKFFETPRFFRNLKGYGLNVLSTVEYAEGNYEKALEILISNKENFAKDYDLTECYLYLALVTLKLGRVDEAKSYFEESKQRDKTYNQKIKFEKLEKLIMRKENN